MPSATAAARRGAKRTEPSGALCGEPSKMPATMSSLPSPSRSASAGAASQFSSQLPSSVARSVGACTGPEEPFAAALQDGVVGTPAEPPFPPVEPPPVPPPEPPEPPPEPEPPPLPPSPALPELESLLHAVIASSTPITTPKREPTMSLADSSAWDLSTVERHLTAAPAASRTRRDTSHLSSHRSSPRPSYISR